MTGAGDDGVFRVTEMEKALDYDFSSKAIADLDISDESLCLIFMQAPSIVHT